MIDTHAHLTMSPIKERLEEVLAVANQEGVHTIVTIATTLEDSKESVQLAKKYPSIIPAVGVHPEVVEHCFTANVPFDSFLSDVGLQLKALLNNESSIKVVGETGLDYCGLQSLLQHEARPCITAQKRLFGLQVQLAKQYSKVLSIHCRSNTTATGEGATYDAYRDLLDTLDHFVKDDGVYPAFILHCISGSLEYIESAVERGAYISFAGNLTYPKSAHIAGILSIVPKDRILIETDCPFLSPQSRRGARNEPSYMKETAQCAANILGMSLEEFTALTEENTYRLLGLQ